MNRCIICDLTDNPDINNHPDISKADFFVPYNDGQICNHCHQEINDTVAEDNLYDQYETDLGFNYGWQK